MDTKIRIFKIIVNLVGLGATFLGTLALFDLVLNNDWNGILPFITVVGFMGPGIALLIVGKQLNYALMDIEIDQRKK